MQRCDTALSDISSITRLKNDQGLVFSQQGAQTRQKSIAEGSVIRDLMASMLVKLESLVKDIPALASASLEKLKEYSHDPSIGTPGASDPSTAAAVPNAHESEHGSSPLVLKDLNSSMAVDAEQEVEAADYETESGVIKGQELAPAE